MNSSDFLESRNFDVLSQQYGPQLIWQPANNLRVVGTYERKGNENLQIEGLSESSTLQTLRGELTFNQADKGSLRSTFSFVNIDFTGDPNSYLGYILLDALQPGQNQTWLYNGRKSENQNAIHTGTVEVTAFF